MNSSEMKYVLVSSPHTCNVSENYSSPNLTQADFHLANWKRPPVSEGSFTSGLRDSLESDTESLVQERQYQLELQQWIDENEELVELCSDELENDSLEEVILKEGLEDDTDQCTNGIQKNEGDGRHQQTVDKYFNLRYNPQWKNMKMATEFSEAEETCQVAGESSMDFAQDAFYLHSDDISEGKNQQEAKLQDSFSKSGTKSLSLHKRDAVGSNEAFGLCTRRKAAAGGCHFKASPSRVQTQEDQPQKAKIDFVAKNKQTLGLPSEKTNSYLQLHSKKQQVLQEQLTDPTTADEEPVQSVLPFQTVKMEPEGKWYQREQQLKLTDPATVGEEPVQSVLQFQTVKMEPEDKWYQKAQQLKKFNPAEFVSPTYTSKENRKYQHDSPDGFPHSQHHSYSHATLQPFARGSSSNGQAHPNQRNIPSVFDASFQERLLDQASLQDHKRHTSVDIRPFQSYIQSSSTAPGTTSHFAPICEQHHHGISHVTEAHLADRHLFSLLPATVSQVESGSELNPENGEGNQVQMSQSNSEVYLMQMKKQNQPKVSKKTYSSKAFINLNVKLGGLGPDYEAIKEKKEKLKQQKEYAKQIKERNMRTIASVQRLPAKPQLVSSVSRQKALEYAKKIPRPKTFMARQSDEEVKGQRVLPRTLNEDSLPQITPLETLLNQHKKEKQIVAAFRTLHIL